MATPENTFIGAVHRHLPAGLYHMKNHNQYNSGIADVWYSGPAADLWIEYKFVVLPKRDNTDIVIALSELQKDWLRARHSEGRTTGVIVGCKEGGVWFPRMSWEPAVVSTAKFRKSLESRQRLAGTIIRIVS